MRPLSPETQALLDRLHRSFRGFAREPAHEILRQIAATGEPALLPRIAPCLTSPEPETFAAGVRAVHRLLGQLAPLDYVWLDESLRRVSYADLSVWGDRPLAAADLQRFVSLQDAAPSVLGLASCNASGYVREAAIDHLARSGSGAALPFLLLRANDWVERVRTVALQAVEALCRQSHAADFLRYLPLVCRLEWTERGRCPDLVRRVERLLQAPENVDLLAEGCLSPDRRIRQACFRLRLEAASDRPWDVLRQALRSSDPILRLWAARSACALPPSDEIHGLLDRMTRDRFVPVRALALATFAGRHPEEARWDIFAREERSHVRKNLLLLFDHLGKWDRLFYLLRASQDRDPLLADLALINIHRWRFCFNRSFTVPTEDQRKQLKELLAELAPRFQELDFYLKV